MFYEMTDRFFERSRRVLIQPREKFFRGAPAIKKMQHFRSDGRSARSSSRRVILKDEPPSLPIRDKEGRAPKSPLFRFSHGFDGCEALGNRAITYCAPERVLALRRGKTACNNE
jgi:hypothetical protein